GEVGNVSDDLVGVRVGRRPRPRLEDVDREVGVELTGRDALCRLGDELRALGVEASELVVDLRRGTLDDRERADEARRKRLPRDREVLDRSLRGRSPVPVRGQLALAPGVFCGE